MISIALGDKDRWDIGIDSDGNLVMISNINQLVQFLRNKLIFIRGEWRYDIRVGFPYFEFVFVNQPNFLTIESIFKKAILETKEVTKLLDFEMNLENNILRVFFRVDSVFGIVEGEI